MMTAVSPRDRLACIELPIRTTNPLNNSQGTTRGAMFARANDRKNQRKITRYSLLSNSPPPLPVVVKLTRIAPSSGLDDDAVPAALKSVRDELAIWLGLPTNKRGQADDSDPRVTWTYAQERGPMRFYAVRVEIWRRKQ